MVVEADEYTDYWNQEKHYELTNRYFDMTKGLPFEDNFTDIIISDLSLHYFTEKTTFRIIDEIKRVLKPEGMFIFRVNSVKDVNHGAGERKEIERHLFETADGRYKTFFDSDDIENFFGEWKKIFVREETMARYEMEKILWRCGVQVKNKQGMELIGTIDCARYEKKRKQGIIMAYTVKKIMEPDYGCEERPDDYIAMDKVILLDACDIPFFINK